MPSVSPTTSTGSVTLNGTRRNADAFTFRAAAWNDGLLASASETARSGSPPLAVSPTSLKVESNADLDPGAAKNSNPAAPPASK